MRYGKNMRANTGAIELGIRGEKASTCDHIAFLWETVEEFTEGVGFLEAGLRGDDHCVIFGHEEANEEVSRILSGHGFDPDALEAAGRLNVLGGTHAGDAMLCEIGAAFQEACDRGAPLIRLLGNIGWGKPNWPEEQEILAFEARVTKAARAFPCVIVCMYDVRTLPGRVIVHGAFKNHPLTICGNIMRENPHYVEMDEFLARLPSCIDAG